MGLEPTTFCMASRSWIFASPRKCLHITHFHAALAKRDIPGLPAITGDSANQAQTVAGTRCGYLLGLVARIVEPIAPNFAALRRVSSDVDRP